MLKLYYLEGHEDYELLREYLNEEQLEYMNDEIEVYEMSNSSSKSCLDEYSDIIAWYEGLINTRDVIDYVLEEYGSSNIYE